MDKIDIFKNFRLVAFFTFPAFLTFFAILGGGCGKREIRVVEITPGGGVVRVMLETGAKMVTIKCSTSCQLLDDESQNVLASGERTSIRIRVQDQNILVEDRPVKATSLRFLSDAPWTVGEKQYRGRLVIKSLKDGGGLLVLNELSIEEYLYGVVPREMSSREPLEALKAQAVAARTYAYSRMLRSGTTFDVDTTALTQVYGGVAAERPASTKAVNETRHQVMTYENKMAQTPYHGNSGGETEDVENVWGYFLPYLRRTAVPQCDWSPNYRWKAFMEWDRLEAVLVKGGISAKGLQGIEVSGRYESDRVKSLRILVGEKWILLKANDFRRSLGNQFLRSTKFSIKGEEKGVEFQGLGWGHGVGMCQDGAVGMARDGATYETILKKFYEGAVLKKITAPGG